jgi:GntR family transcriptional regulator
LVFTSQLFDSKSVVVDFSTSYFIPGYFYFHVNRRIGS